MATILLIEDDIIAARMVLKMLTPRGYTVHHVSTGKEGLQLASELRPDLVLVDLGLPDLDGKVVALQLSHSLPGRSSLIVAFTMETGKKAQRTAESYGCHDFISKPINLHTFPDQVAGFLARLQSVHQ